MGMEKAALRKQGLSARRGLSDSERADCNARINAAIVDSDLFRSANTILFYRAVCGEVCLDASIGQALLLGKRTLFPRCTSKTEMEAFLPKAPDAFLPGSFRIPEPDPSRAICIDPREIDLVLLPAAAFHENKHRIGMGAGYYDRYLMRCPGAKKLLVAYECQRVEAFQPDCTDVPADGVVTEMGLR